MLQLQQNTCGRPRTTEMPTHNICWESCTSWARAFNKIRMLPTSGSRKRITADIPTRVMDRIDRGEQRPPSIMLAATRLLYHMGNIFRDNAPAMPTVGGVHIDRKRLQELQRKRIALGHKPDDHELEPQGSTMQFH